MNTRWYSLSVSSPLIGSSILSANIRSLTGATIVSIRRDRDTQINYPDEDTEFQAGDRCLVVGSIDEQQAFDRLLKGEITISSPSTPCQWVVIPPQSQVIGQTLDSLNWRSQYGVEVQALRRDGSLMRLPNGDTKLIAGDRLLLSGGSYPLQKLERLIAPTVSLPLLEIPVSEAIQQVVPVEVRVEE
jgi:CPA2 family monovalent cation:H+ antiporter-2